MADKHVETLVATLDDGTHIIEHADGRLEKSKPRTDWKRLAAMTEEEIEAGAKSDRYNPPLDKGFLAKMQPVEVPRKRRVTMMLDTDIIEHFSRRGRGYQTRINAVLRRYIEALRKAG
jgi:uncharacterized protein (DUF4415 family)